MPVTRTKRASLCSVPGRVAAVCTRDSRCLRCVQQITAGVVCEQLVECKESGAAGALGIVCQVSAGGTATISSFAAALGLDAPVEVCFQCFIDSWNS